MVQRVNKFGYEVDKALLNFINADVLSGLGIEEEAFWNNFARLFFPSLLTLTIHPGVVVMVDDIVNRVWEYDGEKIFLIFIKGQMLILP